MTTLNMPQLGESVFEGTIGKWLVHEGDRVEKDQAVVEVLTDKADSELPAPEAGVVTKLIAQEGDTVAVGAALCEIDANASAAPKKSGAAPAQSKPPQSSASAEVQASPAVRKQARDKGVDLSKVEGTGNGGRITKADVDRAAAPGSNATPPPPPAADPARTTLAGTPAVQAAAPASHTRNAFRMPPYVAKPGDEVVPFNRRRRIIADHMVFSKQTAPEVVTVAECDLHHTAKLRDAHKGALKKEGISLTYLAFVAAATTRSLREHRELNARVLDDAYVLLRDVNLGIAVDTPDGLVVPVIRNADELSVRGVARSIGELALKARDGNLTPDDLSSKTFTITNPGRKGNMFGGAIISQPNVGILRIGEIQKRVVVVERDGEDLMAIHPVMHMALTYDHRIVDGVAANSFLFRIVELLESGDFEI